MKPIYLLPILSLALLVATSSVNAASSSKKTAPTRENTETSSNKAISQSEKAATSLLRIACDGDDVGAEVQINGKFKGECPLDIKIAEGTYKLRVLKTVDDTHERVFEQDLRMGDGVVKKVEAILVTRFNAVGQKREDERLVIEHAEAQKQRELQQAEAAKREQERLRVETAKREEFDAALATLRQQGAEFGNGKPFHDCPDCPEMVLIPAGDFEMGSKNGGANEKPPHTVNVKIFAIGKTEVTQGQWKAVMGSNPSSFKDCGDTCPVENVSWNDVQAFIQKLNAKTGKQYRLPSEAEWEYACRAGSQQEYCGSDNIDSVAWYNGNSGNKTHPAGQKQANAWGLYDMSGNVWEWLEDNYHDNYNGAPTDGSAWQGDGAKRVLRGGSWYFELQNARAANRVRDDPALRNYNDGFRLARTLP